MDDYKNYIVIGHKYNGLGESADPDSWDNVKYDFNELDNILFAEYVDHQLFIIGKQNEKTTFIRREVTE